MALRELPRITASLSLATPAASLITASFTGGATGLEPATFGVTGQQFSMWNQSAFRLLRCQIGP